MQYELLWQSGDRDTPYPLEAVEAALASRNVIVRPDGGRSWVLKSAPIDLGAVNEAGKQVATELKISLSERDAPVREAVKEASELAAELGLVLFDPQLMRQITERDADAVAEQFLRTARYAGEMLGLPEAVAASFAPPVETKLLSPGMKVILLIIGALVLALWSLEWFLVPPMPPRG